MARRRPFSEAQRKWQRKARRKATRAGRCRSCRGKGVPRKGLKTCDHCLELQKRKKQRLQKPASLEICLECLAVGAHRFSCPAFFGVAA